MRKAIALVLVISLLALSGNLYAAKKGAEVLVTKTDGTQVKGELIAIKENSLLLLDDDTGGDVSVDVSEIRVVRIVNKSRSGLGAGLTFLTFGGVGALLGFLSGSSPSGLLTGSNKAIIFGIAFGLVGLMLGGIEGTAAGTDETIQIEGKSGAEIQESLEHLRKKARIRNYQ